MFISKTDTVEPARVKEMVQLLKQSAGIKEIGTISIYDTEQMARAKKVLNTIKEERGIEPTSQTPPTAI